jgi:hypothetical protein
MHVTRTASSFAALASVGAALCLAADPPDPGPPRGGLLLVQSELDLLAHASRVVTLEFDAARPSAVLQAIEEKSGLTIEVQGTLPERAGLSRSFREATVKEVLTWFSHELQVSFKAEPPDKLSVIVHASEAPPARQGG